MVLIEQFEALDAQLALAEQAVAEAIQAGNRSLIVEAANLHLAVAKDINDLAIQIDQGDVFVALAA